MTLADQIFELIKKTSSTLPKDVKQVLKGNRSLSHIFEIIQETLEISVKDSLPICQDTGFPYFYLKLPLKKAPLIENIEEAIADALKKATEKGILRPNSVDPISNINYGNNLGEHLPYIDYHFTQEDKITCYLLLKGGGSENASGQYSLPLSEIKAGRDKKGIINTVLFHLQKIQGQGCAPGIIGIGIGGDRALSMKLAKNQLFRNLDDSAADPALSELEKEILSKANQLEIGPMGLGGKPTLLAVKAAKAARHPASFFVSISYLCWVARRGECILSIN